jgi:EAL domain-containing protein (putative c-di-GMP-specific phosphodiesterase class I)
MNDAVDERLAIEESLRTARPEESFAVFYQPIVRTATDEPIGYEALLRWRHPERGFVPPESFMDVAEQTGLIVPIGRWVLETACRWTVSLEGPSGPSTSVSVNVSTRQLSDPAFVQDVFEIIRRTGLAPERLHLEITESTAFDAEVVAPVLAELRAEGIHITAEGFGGGFAALSRLRDYPVDVVKIDRSFVKDIAADAVGEAMVRTIVDTARVLDVFVVAAGVETEEEYAAVKRLGCDAAQGFYLQSPAPPAPA